MKLPSFQILFSLIFLTAVATAAAVERDDPANGKPPPKKHCDPFTPLVSQPIIHQGKNKNAVKSVHMDCNNGHGGNRQHTIHVTGPRGCQDAKPKNGLQQIRVYDAQDNKFGNPLASGVTRSGTFNCPRGGVQVLVDFKANDDKTVQEDSKHYALRLEN